MHACCIYICTVVYLRTYPPRFALRIAKYFDRFIERKEALPQNQTYALTTAKDVFKVLTWDKDPWHDAGLVDLFLYLRGSKSLNLGDWRELMPTHIPPPKNP